ncbi:MAG TPA: GAF domain-containing protein, partial [Pyrinomonadaceae bacterium]
MNRRFTQINADRKKDETTEYRRTKRIYFILLIETRSLLYLVLICVYLRHLRFLYQKSLCPSAAKIFRDKLERMAESLAFSKTKDRKVIYEEIAPQIEALVAGETDLVANLANVAAALKEAFGFFWVGFYLVKENQLVLSAFQGSVACTRIDFDKGVCGHCYTTKETVIVADVEKFPGHIACSSLSKSEIVLPIFDEAGEVFGVLDVDSDRLDDFSTVDAEG